MLDKIGQNSIYEVNHPMPTQSGQSRRASGEPADASLRVDYKELISKAKEAGRREELTVEKARELIRSGQLETEESIRGAAESILALGI